MEHQTFSKHGLEKAVRKSDFLNVSKEDQEAYREKLILGSMLAAKTRFSAPSNPLSLFRLNGNLVFKLDKHSDRIVERRLTANLRRACGIRAASRSAVIENLKIFLKEGVPFRIYRLDIRKFYESFPKEAIKEKIDSVSRLSSPSKSLIKAILDKHSQIGGNGTPRGLAISSVITELMMRDFDRQIHNNINTFFYSRYVDDIIVITSSDEDSKEFIAGIKKNLPQGLTLNPSKLTVSPKVAPLFTVQVVAPKVVVASFEYLGYKLTISNPYKNAIDKNYRVVEIDIAEKKSNKYKLRLSRAFHDFSKKRDWALLKDRVRYLTNNFKVFNPHIGKTKLAGIYHNYPAIQFESRNLKGLDHYLRGLVLNKIGRLEKLVPLLLTSSMKRELLSNSFVKGHVEKRFIHFSSVRINEIKKCWKH